ncbi:VOC family protein [Nocardioides glacieisoli]|uniref:VOC family protein n=1 Tax=Nocardioides glacieisoli TaxID=1168730 RepID=A0A4Q2RPU8_9ACTN|nr:VOC family protein [Nocardioides glacieisoli]RYB89699.1 VOC family protein [Nocardioides glacieisoli]
MGARFDHLVVAVEDLDEAAVRWRAAGIPAERGGRHPVGTENVLIRGPEPAYVELIAAGSDRSNPWLDRVRSARGPISWAVAVDDLDAARTALVAAGLEPDEPVPGSRRTPDGDEVAWRVCDVGPGPYDGSLPFLIEWTTPMPAGPGDGPVVEGFTIVPPDPERVADLLLALGFEPDPLWPRRVFEDSAGVRVTVAPVGRPVGKVSWTMGWETPDEPAASLVLRTPSGATTHHDLDGVGVLTWPDRRQFTAASLRPEDGPGSATERADAWVRAVVGAGIGTARDVEVTWADVPALEVVSATRLDGPPGTQPVTVVRGRHPVDDRDVVVIGVGHPVEVIERQPVGLRPESRVRQVGFVDDAFVHALSGGVYAVRGRRRSVVRHFNGLSSHGRFADGEQEQWLEQAAAGRRTDGVVAGDAWL